MALLLARGLLSFAKTRDSRVFPAKGVSTWPHLALLLLAGKYRRAVRSLGSSFTAFAQNLVDSSSFFCIGAYVHQIARVIRRQVHGAAEFGFCACVPSLGEAHAPIRMRLGIGGRNVTRPAVQSKGQVTRKHKRRKRSPKARDSQRPER